MIQSCSEETDETDATYSEVQWETDLKALASAPPLAVTYRAEQKYLLSCFRHAAPLPSRQLLQLFFCWSEKNRSDPWLKTVIRSEPWVLWSAAPLIVKLIVEYRPQWEVDMMEQMERSLSSWWFAHWRACLHTVHAYFRPTSVQLGEHQTVSAKLHLKPCFAEIYDGSPPPIPLLTVFFFFCVGKRTV